MLWTLQISLEAPPSYRLDSPPALGKNVPFRVKEGNRGECSCEPSRRTDRSYERGEDLEGAVECSKDSASRHRGGVRSCGARIRHRRRDLLEDVVGQCSRGCDNGPRVASAEPHQPDPGERHVSRFPRAFRALGATSCMRQSRSTARPAAQSIASRRTYPSALTPERSPRPRERTGSARRTVSRQLSRQIFDAKSLILSAPPKGKGPVTRAFYRWALEDLNL